MSTKIEWAGETWNPVTGCTRVSDACTNCYIERQIPMRSKGRFFRDAGGNRSNEIGSTTGGRPRVDRRRPHHGWEHALMGRAIVKLADDVYIEWSTVVDAPISHVKTRAEAARLWGEDRTARAEANGHSFVDSDPDHEFAAFNRAGPNEEQITVAAIIRRYASGACEDEPLTVEDIAPGWTNWFLPDGREHDEHGPVYAWRPWRPGEEPDEMPDPETYHSMWTRIYPDELADLTAETTDA